MTSSSGRARTWLLGVLGFAGIACITVLLLALGLGIAAIVCADLVVTSLSSRAQ